MLKLTTFILVALIKTPGEGGVATIPFPTEDACQAALAEMESDMAEITPNPAKPKITVQVLGTCIAAD